MPDDGRPLLDLLRRCGAWTKLEAAAAAADEPAARQHAEAVAAELRGSGCEIDAQMVQAIAEARARERLDRVKAADAAAGVDVVRLCDVRPEPIRWLWPGRIARGALTVIAGHPGLGKSQLALAIAAHVTRGAPWPVNGAACEQGDVLLLTAEDDIAHTIRPRLDAAGADASRIHVVEAVRDLGRDGRPVRRGFSLTTDVERLEAVLDARPNALAVIVDPVSAYLNGVDTHRNADVRAALAPLAEVAARRGVAVIAVSHLNKIGAGESLLRVNGSLAFVAAARAVWFVMEDPGDSGRRLLLPAKNNLAPPAGGLAFRVVPHALPGGIETSRIEWDTQPVALSADDVMRASAGELEAGRSAVDSAADFLRELLESGPVPAQAVRAATEGAGISWSAVRRARERAGIVVRKEGGRLGERQQKWVWSLPAEKVPAEDAQASCMSALNAFCSDEHLLRPEGPSADNGSDLGRLLQEARERLGWGDADVVDFLQHDAPAPGSVEALRALLAIERVGR